MCEKVLDSSNEEEETESRPTSLESNVSLDHTQTETSNVKKVDENSHESIEPSVSLTPDHTQTEPSNLQKVDENSPNESSYSCD